MPNPNIPQGVLNRLKASLVWNDFPGLNITPAYLGKEMFNLTPEGAITTFIETTTGAVISPEPYQKMTLTAHLLKTQALAPAYKAQLELNSAMGSGTLYPDVATGSGITVYQLQNCAIQNILPLNYNGQDAGWVIVFGGFYSINSSLFDS